MIFDFYNIWYYNIICVINWSNAAILYILLTFVDKKYAYIYSLSTRKSTPNLFICINTGFKYYFQDKNM